MFLLEIIHGKVLFYLSGAATQQAVLACSLMRGAITGFHTRWKILIPSPSVALGDVVPTLEIPGWMVCAFRRHLDEYT